MITVTKKYYIIYNDTQLISDILINSKESLELHTIQKVSQSDDINYIKNKITSKGFKIPEVVENNISDDNQAYWRERNFNIRLTVKTVDTVDEFTELYLNNISDTDLPLINGYVSSTDGAKLEYKN